MDKLARQHLHNFYQAFGPECTRRLGPNRKVRIATGCTGSGAEVFSLLAIVEAFRSICPKLLFEYVFHCELNQKRMQFVRALHKHLGARLEKTHLGEPCFFTDITKLMTSNRQCCVHYDRVYKKKVPRACQIGPFDWFFCSSSSRDLEPKRGTSACLKKSRDGRRRTTPGGLSKTFWAITDIIEKHRPDLVFYENVRDIDRENKAGDSNLTCLQDEWLARGYKCQIISTDMYTFGLPQQRRHIVIVAMNIRDPRLFTFGDRDVSRVLKSLQSLLLLCHRGTECATKYLLPSEDPRVTTALELARAGGELSLIHI